ncbi:hypothetical protein Patl1_21239 [Pistacia atlantica]|uniref:Uncharacterized protein n=1 Tax=Pistacia atlantica TaxID=434234 RepID=A0ACC1BLT3_9ROSI|nr:hypothetical protein Patl1_21239 [Pistacia atlantica]
MALRSLVSKYNVTYITPTFTCYQKPTFDSRGMSQKVVQSNISRRIGLIAAMASALLARDAIFREDVANGFDFRLVAPDQTVEQAESRIRDHAESLLQVKALLEVESWGAAQKALRSSSGYLKQDIYTIIQTKPESERRQLRKLYSDLFNNVTKLDYAARDKDASRVWQCYENIAAALDRILSRI